MTYQLLLTTLGQQKIAAAVNAGSLPVHITQFAIGQGINVDFSQRLDEQVLVSKRYQGAVGSITPTSVTGQYEITCIVPPNEGGWTIRELGLIDSDGDLIWVGQLPEVQKPAANSTAAVDYRIKAVISIDNPDVSLVIDASVITATQDWTIDNFTPLSHLEDADPHNQYVLKDPHEDEFLQLKLQVEELLNRKSIKVGDIYTTSINHADAAAVTEHHGYGVWERYAEGRALVGFSDDVEDNNQYKTMGNEFGADTHTLLLSESPGHKHSQNEILNKFAGKAQDVRLTQYDSNGEGGLTATNADDASLDDEYAIANITDQAWADATEVSRGGNQPHNNNPPSKVVGAWRRTA